MIRRAAEMMSEIRERMRGGEGSVEIVQIVDPAGLGGKCRLLAKLKIAPGSSIGPHRHEGEDEVFYILKGTALVDDNGSQTTVGPGDAVVTGGGALHAVVNNGNEMLEMLAVIILY